MIHKLAAFLSGPFLLLLACGFIFAVIWSLVVPPAPPLPEDDHDD